MSRSHTIIFPDLGDAHATMLVDFLNQLTACHAAMVMHPAHRIA